MQVPFFRWLLARLLLNIILRPIHLQVSLKESIIMELVDWLLLPAIVAAAAVAAVITSGYN